LSVPDDGYTLSVPDDGYNLSVPDDGYTLSVPDHGYTLSVPDDGYSRKATSTFLLHIACQQNWINILVDLNLGHC